MRPTTLTIALLAAAIATVLHLWPQGLTGWVGVATVPDSSMEPTYQSGDVLLLWREPVYEPGDVVAVETSETRIVARVVGGHPLTGYALSGDDESTPLPTLAYGPAVVGRAAIELPAVVGAAARVVSAVPSSLLAAFMAAVVMLRTPGRLRHEWRRRGGSGAATRPRGGSPRPTVVDRPVGSVDAVPLRREAATPGRARRSGPVTPASRPGDVRSPFPGRRRDRSVASPRGEPPPGPPGGPVVEVASMKMLVALARRHHREIRLRRGADDVVRAVFQHGGTTYAHGAPRSVDGAVRTAEAPARAETQPEQVARRYVPVATIHGLQAIAERESSAVRLGRVPDGSRRPSVEAGATTYYVHDGRAATRDDRATRELTDDDDVAPARSGIDVGRVPPAAHAATPTRLATVPERPYVIGGEDGEQTIVLP